MNRPTRMWKTLASLVGAMTGTAALLGWLDPTGQLQTRALSQTDILQVARSAVVDDVPIRVRQWRAIEIVAQPGASRFGTMLAGSADPGDCHFHVGADGRSRRASTWDQQQPMTALPHTVRIEVASTTEGEPIADIQWLAVGALIEALNDQMVPPGQSLPVYVNQDWPKTEDSAGETASDFGATRPTSG